LVIAFSARFVFRQSPSDLICLWQVFVDVDVILGLLLVLVVIFVVLVSSSCSPSRSSGVFFSFSFFWVLLLAVIYDDNRMGGVFDFFIIIINMTSSWSSCSSASSSTCTSCSLVLLDSSAMSTLPYVWLTCAFGHNTRGETHLVCYCASLESAWCPAWNQRRQPRGRARHPEECACGRARFGSAGKAGQTRIGTHACQIRIGEGPGQIRIGNAGGSNPKREEGRITKIKK
jgi:hypothetical protein